MFLSSSSFSSSSFKFRPATEKYSIEIKIHNAKNLVCADMLKSVDPYIVVTCDDFDEFTTSVHHRTCNPTFEESRKMFVSSIVPMKVTCMVYDKNVFSSDEAIGQCSFTVGEDECTGCEEELSLEGVNHTKREAELKQKNAPHGFGKLRVSWSIKKESVSRIDRRDRLLMSVRMFVGAVKQAVIPITLSWRLIQWERPLESVGVFFVLFYLLSVADAVFWVPYFMLTYMGISYVQAHRSITLPSISADTSSASNSQHQHSNEGDADENSSEAIAVRCFMMLHSVLTWRLPSYEQMGRTKGVAALVVIFAVGCVVDVVYWFGLVAVVSAFVFPFLMVRDTPWQITLVVARHLLLQITKMTSPITNPEPPVPRYRSTSVLERRKTLCKFRFESQFEHCNKTSFTARILVEQSDVLSHSHSHSGGARYHSISQPSTPKVSNSGTHSNKNTPDGPKGNASTEQHCLRCEKQFGLLRKRKFCETCKHSYCKNCVRQLAAKDTFECYPCSFVTRHCSELIKGIPVRMQMSEMSQSPTLQPAGKEIPLTLDDLVCLSRLRDALGGDTAVLHVKLDRAQPLRLGTSCLEFHDAAIPLGAVENIKFDSTRYRLTGKLFGWPFIMRVTEDENSAKTKDLAELVDALIKISMK
eukprot:PhF_6_TR34991/c0_g1_i1/m.50847